MSTPTCPLCGSTKAAKAGKGRYKCNRCGGLFDDDPDEGGDYHQRNPSARLEREERERDRRRKHP